jgi:glycosyltransferase involved in cell wall biosynthesis
VTPHRTANLFGRNIGTGLARHIVVVSQCLRAVGYDVVHREIPPRRRGARVVARAQRWLPRGDSVDLNIFLQELVPSWFPRARTNILIPNQEWFDERELKLLWGIDHVVCTSQHALDIFSWRGPNVVKFGFTSEDRLLSDFVGPRHRILHVAGRSPFKGTAALARVWRRHPEWPTLTLMHAEGILEPLSVPNIEQRIGYVEDQVLRRLQNESWLHLFPTEAEAFGHSLCEGLSVGALVLTVDGPPMNELVRADRGVLVPYQSETRLHLGWRFFVDEAALERTLVEVISCGPHWYAPMMARARSWFVHNDARVRRDLSEFFDRVTRR